MFWSVHDHPDGRNRAHARADGAVERGRRLHVDRDRAGREQFRPFLTADDVIGAGERPRVDGAPGQGACQFLDEQIGAHAGRGAARVPDLVGDDQVPRVHAGGEPGAEARGQDGRPAQRGAGQSPGDRPFGGTRPHARTQHGDRAVGTAPITLGNPTATLKTTPFDVNTVTTCVANTPSSSGSDYTVQADQETEPSCRVGYATLGDLIRYYNTPC